jgi:hypothetical protein
MARGEAGPGLYGRPDLAAWQVAMRKVRNCFVHVQGGASNRPGLEMGVVARLANRQVRLLPFIYSAEQAYTLEVGHQYLRIVKDNAYVLRAAVNVTGATTASPGVITAVAHGAVVGEVVYFAGVGGMTRLNGRYFEVNTTPTANTMTLRDFTGTVIDTTDTDVWGAYTSGGTVSRVAQYSAPWVEADLPYLNYAQQADVLKVACRGVNEYDETEISRGANHYDWTVTNPVVYGPRVAAPINLVTAQNYGIRIIEIELDAAGPQEIRLRVTPKRPPTRDGDKLRLSDLVTPTAFPELDGQEVLQSRSDPDGTNSDMWIVQTNGLPFDTSVGTWPAASTTYSDLEGTISTEPILKWRVTAVDKNGEESLASPEVVRRRTTNPQQTAPVMIKWTPPLLTANGAPRTDIARFYVYKEKNGLYGFIGQREVESRTPMQITGITNANPGVVTTFAAHGLTENDVVYIYDVTGMTQVNGTSWKVGTVGSPTTFQLKQMNGENLNTTAFGVWTGIGQNELVVSDYWFEDDDIAPELEDPAPPTTVTNPFAETGNKPRAVGFHEQRYVLAGTANDPLKAFLSQIAHYYNWNESEPRRPDDAIQYTLASARGAGILHLLSMKDLFFWTPDGVWVSQSGDSGGYTLDNIRNEEISRHGSAVYPAPIAADRSVLYVHRSRRRVMDLAWDMAGAGYDGNDQALMAPHLFEDKRIVDWCYQDYPERLVWIVLDDGSLVSLSYLPKHDVFGWARHDTDGTVEAIACIPEGDGDDAVYIAVDRGVASAGGRRYIERLHTREFTDVRDAFFVDSGLTLDSPVAMTAATAAEPVVVTAAGHGVANGDYVDFSDVEGMTELNELTARVGHVVGNAVWLMSRLFENGADKNITGITNTSPAIVTCVGHGRADGDLIYISNVNGMTEVNDRFYKINLIDVDSFELQDLAGANVDATAWGTYTNDGRMDVAAHLDGTAFEAYTGGGYLREAFQTIGGLDHLIGETVSAVANGAVQEGLVVDSLGRVELSAHAGRVHIGLPYTSELETLDLIDPGGELVGLVRHVTKLWLRVQKTRGVRYGLPEGDVYQVFNPLGTDLEAPTDFLEGEIEVTMPARGNLSGRVLLQQTEPLPMTVLGVVTEFEVVR